MPVQAESNSKQVARVMGFSGLKIALKLLVSINFRMIEKGYLT
jgi:hypothetical protein